MKKLSKLKLRDAVVMSSAQMKQISGGGGSYGGSYGDGDMLCDISLESVDCKIERQCVQNNKVGKCKPHHVSELQRYVCACVV